MRAMAKWFEKMGKELSKISKEVGKGAKVAAAEVSRGASVAVREVSQGAMLAASEMRKTVGVGVGGLSLELEKLHFHPGDSVLGSLVLELNEPIEANSLVIGIKGSQSTLGDDGTVSEPSRRIYEFEIELASTQTFKSRRYDFELRIPSNAIEVEPGVRSGGVLGDVARVVSSVTTRPTDPVAWSVFAFLDIPWKRNLAEAVDIAVTEE